MEIFEYLTGRGGFLILAVAVIFVVVYRKIKQRRDIKAVSKKRKK